MSDPTPVDVRIQPPPKEAPPAVKVKAPAPEKPASVKKDAQPPKGVARKALEDIAAGKSVAEALAPTPEPLPLPDRQTVSGLISEANTMLLDAHDPRILVTALATQAEDTPLGNEMRVESLRMIATMKNDQLPPATVVRLDALQKKILDLKLPEAKPEQSALLHTINTYNESHPQAPVPPEVVDQIQSGAAEAAPTVAKLLQGNTELAGAVWKDLTGLPNFSGFDPTPERILALTQMDQTPENLKKMHQIFGEIKKNKASIDLMSKVVPGIIIASMGIMFVSQIAGMDQGAGGH